MKNAVARRRLPCAALPLSVISFVCLPAAAEPYLGQFELKTLDGFGILEGMNHNTASHTLKLSIEVNF